MAKIGLLVLLYPLLLLIALMQSCHGNRERKVHIVYMGERPRGDFSIASTHHSMLEGVLGNTSLAKESLIYSYGRSFNGFAAKLTDKEVRKLSAMECVISVLPNRKLKLHTTRSWDFVGLTSNLVGDQWDDQGNVIIGLLDSGIWPESESFSDEGLSSPPKKWKGKCQGANFTCNNKIIGARYYNSQQVFESFEFKSPRDSNGHGTHTSSTAAGRKVARANYFGLANGTARGGVPSARIAMYKVCWLAGCYTADILAGFDDAIADGVDIISVSLGSGTAVQYFQDPIAIGSFHAMRKGILTSGSAGNSGPFPSTINNDAPWILTVAANTIDRKFVAQVVLGNGQVYTGLSINSFNLNGKSFPLISGRNAAKAGFDPETSKYCTPASLNSSKVQGKIVYCETPNDDTGVLKAKGVGIIMTDSSTNNFAFSYSLPATLISKEDGLRIIDYIRSTKNPMATILAGETLKDVMAPYVATFSSRGPSIIIPDILKPDLSAPGADILAAWSPVAPPTHDLCDTRSVKFNIISGTSMSCPHASGAAAYVKAAHPNWSPAAIKSALMTTAYEMDPKKHGDLEFAYGSGHLNPSKAIDPGLVYDTSEADYIDFLCKQGYDNTALSHITGDNSSFCTNTKPEGAWNLNYPSFSLAVEDGSQIKAVFTRTVTNVGPPNSTYTLSLHMPPSITVGVNPSVLSFSATGEKKKFIVNIQGPKIVPQPITSGVIIWTSGVHVVRSPIVVYSVQK